MKPIETAILRTLLYADVFNFAMTVEEIHRYLIYPQAIPLEKIHTTLENSTTLASHVMHQAGYFAHISNHVAIPLRQQREYLAQQMTPVAQRYGALLANIPFVRMVALTGALAVRNPAHERDDYDYILVTEPGRVWIARACAIFIVRVARVFGKTICPNYVLDVEQLLQQRRDLFIAHEIAQMMPLYGYEWYLQMIEDNNWIYDWLPNALPSDAPQATEATWFKRLFERLLKGNWGNRLEAWEFRRKARKFAPQVAQPQAHAIIDPTQVKGHFEDHGHPILTAYYERIANYGLSQTEELPVAK